MQCSHWLEVHLLNKLGSPQLLSGISSSLVDMVQCCRLCQPVTIPFQRVPHHGLEKLLVLPVDSSECSWHRAVGNVGPVRTVVNQPAVPAAPLPMVFHKTSHTSVYLYETPIFLMPVVSLSPDPPRLMTWKSVVLCSMAQGCQLESRTLSLCV